MRKIWYGLCIVINVCMNAMPGLYGRRSSFCRCWLSCTPPTTVCTTTCDTVPCQSAILRLACRRLPSAMSTPSGQSPFRVRCICCWYIVSCCCFTHPEQTAISRHFNSISTDFQKKLNLFLFSCSFPS